MTLPKSSTQPFNTNWRFSLDNPENAHEPTFDDTHWRTLRVPHDWSIEAHYDPNLEGATGYLPGGIGWYRKHFELELPAEGERIFLYFDGIYNHATVFMNGHEVVFHPYGYSPFFVDVTPFVQTQNVVAVRVDRTRYADSRWYTGSGIYRNVKLIRKHAVHIPIWGAYITTPTITHANASTRLELQLMNALPEDALVQVCSEFFAPSGELAAIKRDDVKLSASSGQTLIQDVTILQPALWSPDDPALYTVKSSLKMNNVITDTYESTFGIRSFKFTADNGFFINGENTLIKGVCLHHEAGLAGAAVPDAVWQQRLQTLKDAGCNAIRTAHNPPSEAFLDLCDRMGFLVQDEFFDDWDYPKDKRLNKNERTPDPITDSYTRYFQTHAEQDLKNTMLRDRNHPSVFQWSIGNEIEWTYERYHHAPGYFEPSWQGNYFWELPPYSPEEIKQRLDAQPAKEHTLAATAHKLASWTRELDTTRVITNNCIFPAVSHVSGYADAVDVMGYSYRRALYDYAHALYPDKPLMGTENLGQWHEWKAVLERPFIPGVFLWTGIDYLGEAHEQWPKKTLGTGLLNTAGFDKPSYHMFKSLWTNEPYVRAFTQTLEKSLYTQDTNGNITPKNPDAWQHALWVWQDVNPHWNYQPGQHIAVEAYSNQPELELRLNNKSYGTKKLEWFEDHIYKWLVPFEAGELRVISPDGAASHALVTAGEPVKVRLLADKHVLSADNVDCVHVVAQLLDANNHEVKHTERRIRFEVEGDVRVLGVDSGGSHSMRTHNARELVTHEGRALMILQANQQRGCVRVSTVSADNEQTTLSSDTLTLELVS